MLDPDRIEFIFDPLLPNYVHPLLLRKADDVLEIRRGRVSRTKDLVLHSRQKSPHNPKLVNSNSRPYTLKLAGLEERLTI